MKKQQEFKDWFIELVEYGHENGLPVNYGDPESYKDYWEDGYTPSEALREDFENLN